MDPPTVEEFERQRAENRSSLGVAGLAEADEQVVDRTTPEETVQTHYTISEDETGGRSESKLVALASRSQASPHLGASEFLHHNNSGPALQEDHAPPINRIALSYPRGPRTATHPYPFTSSLSASPLTVTRSSLPRRVSGRPQKWPGNDQIHQAVGDVRETATFEEQTPRVHSYSNLPDLGLKARWSHSESERALKFDSQLLAASGANRNHTGSVEHFEGTSRNFPELLDSSTAPSVYVDLLQKMQQRIQQLEEEKERSYQSSRQHSGINMEVFYCLLDQDNENAESVVIYDDVPNEPNTYLSEPEWEICPNNIRLRARFQVLDPQGYVEKKPNTAFIVYKYYTVDHQRSAVEDARKFNKPLPSPEPAYQDVLLISDEMVEAVEALFVLHPSIRNEFPKDIKDTKMRAPYLWWYHCRKSNKIQSLPQDQAQLVTVLINWIEENYGSLYEQIDDQFRRGRVSNVSMECLFRPDQVLVSFIGDVPKGYIAITHPRVSSDVLGGSNDHGSRWGWGWSISARSYSYYGEFISDQEDMGFSFEAETKDGEVEIASLPVVPLEYTTRDIQERLVRRGKTFWKCRHKRLVSYEDSSTGTAQIGGRFMIDYNTHKKLHPDAKSSKPPPSTTFLQKGLDSEPQAPEIYLFPNQVSGFDLRRKKWGKKPFVEKCQYILTDGTKVDLDVDKIHDVVWNENAFRNLVADEDMKTLILALVTSQLEAERGTDVIDNKGNGLIMLLHGSPGTGKTFTAESVAEIAKKPLYLVTCGDIGTEPEAVEKYLESVFYLGKIWDCVVLLDEAEVFLEQRTLQDLKRNALVSIFLRALEYYDGILILTTNRVGTFDEAFKSRIQLALRYERLKDYQRKQIWRNFFNRLKALGEEDSIDFDDIVLHLDELAQYPMNGRQIRNSITTARQLAKFMKKRMVFAHLQRTISIMDKFDRYLADVREADVEEPGGRGLDGRYSDEYFARSDQIR